MRFYLLLLISICPLVCLADADLRSKYNHADDNKILAQEFNQICQSKLKSAPQNFYYQAYLAASTMIQAKFTFNPYLKLQRFRHGRDQLESIIKSQPNDIELRYIRFAMQSFAPKFLGYHKEIDIDFRLLQQYSQKDTSDKDLSKDILDLFKELDYELVSK